MAILDEMKEIGRFWVPSFSPRWPTNTAVVILTRGEDKVNGKYTLFSPGARIKSMGNLRYSHPG